MHPLITTRRAFVRGTAPGPRWGAPPRPRYNNTPPPPPTPPRRPCGGGTATGVALLGVAGPGLLGGCNRGASTTMIPGDQSHLSEHLAFFSVDEPTITRVMSELTARGADAADLYFQHSRDNSITMEDGIISRASSSVDQGVGLRVVVGDQTGYAVTEDLSLESMLGAARTAEDLGRAFPGIPILTSAGLPASKATRAACC